MTNEPRYQQQSLCFDNERLKELSESARNEVLEALIELLRAAASSRNERGLASMEERNENA